jgi:hypothetical protein
LLGLPPAAVDVLEWFNPYFSMNRVVFAGDATRALQTAGCWAGLGLLGTALAVWRLRPTCLSVGVTRAKVVRRRKAPVVGERPMLWKELYIERVASLGRFGRWVGALLTLAIGGGSLVLAGMIVYSGLFAPSSDLYSVASDTGEISVAKLLGSIYALRYLAAAMLLAWTLAALVGAVSVSSYITWIVGNLVMGAFMAAVGVRFSLSLPTATRAMSWTIGVWLGLWPVIGFIAISAIGFIVIACTSIWSLLMSYGLIATNSRPWFPMTFELGWTLTTNLTTFLLTVLIVADTSFRFDRIAGRMAGGTLATTVDAMVHGTAHKAVFLPDEKAAKKKKARTELPLDAEFATPSA